MEAGEDGSRGGWEQGRMGAGVDESRAGVDESRGGREQGRMGAGEDGSRGGWEQVRTGAGEDGSRGGREQGRTGAGKDGSKEGREQGRTGAGEDGRWTRHLDADCDTNNVLHKSLQASSDFLLCALHHKMELNCGKDAYTGLCGLYLYELVLLRCSGCTLYRSVELYYSDSCLKRSPSSRTYFQVAEAKIHVAEV